MPIITEEVKELITAEILKDLNTWRKQMIHYIKEENPEINSAIIDMANKTDLDPKAVALGAYMTYKMLEHAKGDEGEVSLEEFID